LIVYVGWTRDTYRQRHAVAEAIRAAGHVVLVDAAPASPTLEADDWPADTVHDLARRTETIGLSMAFLAIVGWDSGDEVGDEPTVVEQEYRAAVERGLPCQFVLVGPMRGSTWGSRLLIEAFHMTVSTLTALGRFRQELKKTGHAVEVDSATAEALVPAVQAAVERLDLVAPKWWQRFVIDLLGPGKTGAAAQPDADSPLALQASAAPDEPRPIRLFYSYAHKDERFRDELDEHLALLRRERLIEPWHDRMIGAGDDWRQAIETELETADVILLLISPHFVNSEFCWGEELDRAMARHDRGEARVIPVLLRPMDDGWKKASFGKLQGRPKDGRPILKWRLRDEAYSDVVEGVRKAVEELHALRG
jgi:TIR domain-containing protein